MKGLSEENKKIRIIAVIFFFFFSYSQSDKITRDLRDILA